MEDESFHRATPVNNSRSRLGPVGSIRFKGRRFSRARASYNLHSLVLHPLRGANKPAVWKTWKPRSRETRDYTGGIVVGRMKERKEGRKEEGRGKRQEKEKTPATGVLTLSSLPLSLSSHLWLPGFQPRCFTSFDDANVTRHHHYQPTITTVSLSLSLCTPELDVKIPLHCIVHSLERAPRSTRFRVRVRTSVCVSPGQVNVLSLVVKRDREKERKSGERERGVRKGERRGGGGGESSILLIPFHSLPLSPFPPSPWMNAFLPRRMQRVHFWTLKIRALYPRKGCDGVLRIHVRSRSSHFVKTFFNACSLEKLYSRARVKDE